MVYEFTDHSHRIDENVLVVDFRFDSDVSQEQAIKIVDKIISLADDDNSTAKMTGHTPTLYALSPFKKEIADD
jgi:predicted sugar kinase